MTHVICFQRSFTLAPFRMMLYGLAFIIRSKNNHFPSYMCVYSTTRMEVKASQMGNNYLAQNDVVYLIENVDLVRANFLFILP